MSIESKAILVQKTFKSNTGLMDSFLREIPSRPARFHSLLSGVYGGVLVCMVCTLMSFSIASAFAEQNLDEDPSPSKVSTQEKKAKLIQSLSRTSAGSGLSVEQSLKPTKASGTNSHSTADAASTALENTFKVDPMTTKSQTHSMSNAPGLSDAVYGILLQMPQGGTYSTSSEAIVNFKKSMKVGEQGDLLITPMGAVPSFCSSATYLVFLASLVELQKNKHMNLKKGDLEKLLYARQPDGVGVWGRWNANGPGTARLFQALELGENFTDIEDARRGDFLKIWWTDEIGAKERGHSVIYLGTRTDEKGVQQLKFWSSNIPGGYGEKEIPITKAKHLLFSRLSKPQNLDRLDKLAPRDEYLVSMSSKSFTIDDVLKKLGITKSSP
jgi:hypothetical protein